jgi:hypothetical protein
MTEEQIYELDLQAYLYGHPFVPTEITKQVYLEQGTPSSYIGADSTYNSC